VATSINLLLGRCGNIWHRRYDAQPILSEADATERVRYTLANPQKAGLVHHIDEWPGFVAVAGRTSDCELVAEWLDWSAWHRARSPKDRTPFRRTTAFRLHKLPSHAHRADEHYLADLLADLTPLSDGEWVAMLAAVDGDGLAVIVTRGSTSLFDCGAFLKRAAIAGKGRGGGGHERAEGRMPSDVDGRTFVSSHVNRVDASPHQPRVETSALASITLRA
jgi:hypothetical protein